MREHNTQCWLVNTGWQGGKSGVGKRMDLAYTRAMVRAAVEDRLNNAEFETEPAFGLSIPKAVPDVPSHVLRPRETWTDKAAYDRTAAELAQRFAKNFEQFDVPQEIRAGAPTALAK